MILSFNVRDAHPRDREVIKWYKSLYRSEKSRNIVDILHAHISGETSQTTTVAINHQQPEPPKRREANISMIDVTGDGEEVDLDSKLDRLGGF